VVAVGGADTISVGSGNVVIFGGAGNGTITTSSLPGDPEQDVQSSDGSAHVIFGGTGKVSFCTGGWVASATLTFQPSSGWTPSLSAKSACRAAGHGRRTDDDARHADLPDGIRFGTYRPEYQPEPDLKATAADRGRSRGDLAQLLGSW
jgi:Ca2+-binding RTX toxin-like protein